MGKFKWTFLRLTEDSQAPNFRISLGSEQCLGLGVVSRNNLLDPGGVGKGLFLPRPLPLGSL